jgi:CheY-like chemotaxis protein
MTYILIAEDSPRDSTEINAAAQQFGSTVSVSTFTELLGLLEGSARFDLLILDLRLPDSEPRNLVQAVQNATGHLKLPVVVVTGYMDDELKRDCESHGWLWVSKESKRFKSDLYYTIRRAMEDKEDSGDSLVSVKTSREQLAGIVAKLESVSASQASIAAEVKELRSTVNDVLDRMFGPVVDRFGNRGPGGCTVTCRQTQGIFDAGNKWVNAVWIASAGAFGGGIVAGLFWLASKVTQ